MGRVYEVSFDTVVLKHRLSEFTDSTDSDGNFADLMNLVLYVPFSVFGKFSSTIVHVREVNSPGI